MFGTESSESFLAPNTRPYVVLVQTEAELRKSAEDRERAAKHRASTAEARAEELEGKLATVQTQLTSERNKATALQALVDAAETANESLRKEVSALKHQVRPDRLPAKPAVSSRTTQPRHCDPARHG